MNAIRTRLDCSHYEMLVLCLLLLAACACSSNSKGENGAIDNVDTLTGSESPPDINWIKVASGSFTFGSPEDFAGCRAPVVEKQVDVTLTRSFVMAETEITQKQWTLLALPNPSINKGDGKPVTYINFYEMALWCNKLSRKEGLTPCYELSSCENSFGNGCPQDSGDPDGCWDESANFNCSGDIHVYPDHYSCPGYRLPTTAEWEYAAKSGTDTHNYGGDINTQQPSYCFEESSLEEIAWYCSNSKDTLHDVKLKQPNQWGFYDILGNAFELVDYFSDGQSLDDLARDQALTDPVGPESGRKKALRGGSFDKDGCYVNSTWHSGAYPYMRRYDTGFRPVRTLFGDEADAVNSADSSDSDSE